MEKSNELMVLPPELATVAQKLNNSVLSVIGSGAIQGFERAYLMASAIKELKALLTPQYMAPIMELQGNKLGFKTDKDKDGGYPEAVVKNCIIEAVLFGLQPTGNQLNIIAGNMYATKEGCGYLLSNIKGLDYDIVAELTRIKDGSAAVSMTVSWTLNGVSKTKKLDIPVKVNNFMGTDAVLGKATRKARKWLFDTITGTEVPEGDVMDTTGTVVSTKINKSKEEIETERMQMLIDSCKTVEEIDKLQKDMAGYSFPTQWFDIKRNQIITKAMTNG